MYTEGEECNAEDNKQIFFIAHYIVKAWHCIGKGWTNVGIAHRDNGIIFTVDMIGWNPLLEGFFVSFDFISLEFDDKNGLQIARV